MEGSLKIWQLDPANLTPYYNLAICEALAKAGQQVHYVTSEYLYDPNLPVSDQFTVEYTYFRGLNQQWLLRSSLLRKLLRGLSYPLDHRRVLAAIKRHHPDIVHIQWSRLPSFDRSFIQSIQAENIPVVHTIHNVRSSFASDQMVSRLGDVYALVDTLVLHTKANQRDFLTLYPHIPKSKTTVIPLINPPYPYQQSKMSRADVRKDFGFSENEFVVLFFGVIRQYKGLKHLLEAFTQVSQGEDSVRLLIAGKAESAQDVDEVEQARNMRNVSVHESFIPSEEVWKYFCVADVVVFPYRYITQSAALIQAMSFGKPVIVTDVGGFPETVDDNGWIVPVADVDAFADAMREAMTTSPLELEKMGKRSLEIVENSHSGASIAQELLANYHRLLPH